MDKADIITTIEQLEAALDELENGNTTYSQFGEYFHDHLAEAVLKGLYDYKLKYKEK